MKVLFLMKRLTMHVRKQRVRHGRILFSLELDMNSLIIILHEQLYEALDI